MTFHIILVFSGLNVNNDCVGIMFILLRNISLFLDYNIFGEYTNALGKLRHCFQLNFFQSFINFWNK